MELKVLCDCGQKYKFEVEPVNGRMPHMINCPVCGVDGTANANDLIGQQISPSVASLAGATDLPTPEAPLVPAVPASPGGLRINRPPMPQPKPASVMASTAAPPIGRPKPTPKPSALPKYMRDDPSVQNNSFILGVVGAFGGALIGVGLMAGWALLTGVRIALIGILIGIFAGTGARIGYRGTDTTLGAMSAAVSFITIVTMLYLMFGIVGSLLVGFTTLALGTAMGWKIASG